jgi:fructuronate reductase
MRLSASTAPKLRGPVRRPAYDRDAQKTGIIHFGIGAFHRAHQAVYTDEAMNMGDRDWRITGVSLRSTSVADQINPQDGLYTVAVREGTTHQTHLIGAVTHVLVARDTPHDVIDALADPSVHIVTMTITEKGYCRASDGSLDPARADEDSIYRYLAQGLALRHLRGLPGLTLLCCDNLAHNGAQLARLFLAYLAAHHPPLVGWVKAQCTFPSSMVDRIVPATTNEDRAAFAVEAGLEDQALVLTEPFSQWVIEDRFAGPRPRWEVGGAQFVADVAPFETAKLRMLNGAHSALAYLGLEAGHVFVHEAVADPALHPLIERLMRKEAAATIATAPGQDLDAYATSLMDRFGNAALAHRLIQIAMDGSQKIPQRWLETLAAHQQKGRQCPVILRAIAAWLRHIRGDRRPVDDAIAPQLADVWQQNGRDGIVGAMFGTGGLIPSAWTPTTDDTAEILQALDALG